MLVDDQTPHKSGCGVSEDPYSHCFSKRNRIRQGNPEHGTVRRRTCKECSSREMYLGGLGQIPSESVASDGQQAGITTFSGVMASGWEANDCFGR